MNDQTAALDALIAAVEAGEFDAPPENARQPYFNRFMDIAEDALPQNVTGCNALAWRAYHQHSLDAARALHDAVLPDRSCSVTFGGEYGATVIFPPTWNQMHLSQSNLIPARAWLLAILRALKSQVNHD